MYTGLVCGFPLILLLFEWGLRTVMAVNTWEFTGPALAAAGVSFLPPLVKPKTLNVKVPSRPDVVVVSKNDQILIPFVWISLLLFLFAWCAACYISLKLPAWTFLGMSMHLDIGLFVYIACLVFVFIKERV